MTVLLVLGRVSAFGTTLVSMSRNPYGEFPIMGVLPEWSYKCIFSGASLVCSGRLPCLKSCLTPALTTFLIHNPTVTKSRVSCDAVWIGLRQHVFRAFAQFLRVLDSRVAACQRVRLGIPTCGTKAIRRTQTCSPRSSLGASLVVALAE